MSDIKESKDGQPNLSGLELSKLLAGIRKKCRNMDVDDPLAACKQQLKNGALVGTEEVPARFPKFNRKAIRKQLVEQVLELSLEYPEWGSKRLAEELVAQGIDISAGTVYNILVEHQMSSLQERLDKRADKQPVRPELLQKKQPGRGRKTVQNVRGNQPAEVLEQDMIYVGSFGNLGALYLQVVIDTYSGYAFGLLYPNDHQDNAVVLLHNEVVPFFKMLQLPIKVVHTDCDRAYSGKPDHNYELYLSLHEIEHSTSQTKQLAADSIVRRFSQWVVAEFFQTIDPSQPQSLELLQYEFKQWLNQYNHRRPAPGAESKVPPYAVIMKHLSFFSGIVGPTLSLGER